MQSYEEEGVPKSYKLLFYIYQTWRNHVIIFKMFLRDPMTTSFLKYKFRLCL